VVVAILAGGVWHVKNRYFTEEEARVRAVIDSLISHLEGDNLLWDVDQIRNHLSEKYCHRGENAPFEITKWRAGRAVAARRHQYAQLKVEISTITVSVSGDTATVDLTGRVMARQKGTADKWIEVMTGGGKNRVIIELEIEDGDWKVVSSQRLSYALPESTRDN
jgi:hypothetical protein